MDDVLTLITETYTTNSFGEEIATETSRDVLARSSEITREEWYRAGQVGLNPDLLIITAACNYAGEKKAAWHGVTYAIYRIYRRAESDEIELYMTRQAGVR